MTIKERIINELREIEFGNDFLQLVGTRWIDEMEDNDEDEYILEEIKNVLEYGANTGGVNFVIWSRDNNDFIKENLDDMFEFLEYCEREWGTKLKEYNADIIMFTAVEMCAFIIENKKVIEKILINNGGCIV